MKWWILGFSILILLLAAHSLERRLLRSELKEAGIQVLNDGTHLDDASNTAMRRTWFLLLTEIDPLFALPGVNLHQFQESITMLASQRDRIAGYYPEEEAAVVRASLYPTTFLTEIVRLEEKRRSLDGTVVKNVSYHLQLLKTMRVYRSDIEALRDALDTHLDDKAVFGYPSDASASTDSIISSLLKLDEVAKEKRSTALLRATCSIYMHPGCPRIMSLVGSRTAISQTTSSPPSRNEKPIRIILDRIHRAAPYYGTGEQFPTIRMSSVCFREATGVLPWTMPVGSTTALRIARADEILIYNVEAEAAALATEKTSATTLQQSGSAITTNQHAFTQGVRLLYQPTGNGYLCPDAGTDFGTMVRTLGVHEALRTQQIFTKEIDAGLYALEAKLRRQDEVLENDASEYIARASAYVHAHGITYTKEALGNDAFKALWETIVQYKSSSYRTEEILAGIVFENTYVENELARGGSFPLKALLWPRSSPSVLFLTFNSSSNSPIAFRSGYRDVNTTPFFTTYSKLQATYSPAWIEAELLRLSKLYED